MQSQLQQGAGAGEASWEALARSSAVDRASQGEGARGEGSPPTPQGLGELQGQQRQAAPCWSSRLDKLDLPSLTCLDGSLGALGTVGSWDATFAGGGQPRVAAAAVAAAAAQGSPHSFKSVVTVAPVLASPALAGVPAPSTEAPLLLRPTTRSTTGRLKMGSGGAAAAKQSKATKTTTKKINGGGKKKKGSSKLSLAIPKKGGASGKQTRPHPNQYTARPRPKRPEGAAPIACQVVGCPHTDLSSLREYYQRYKVCEAHSKQSVVIFPDGEAQRFCQRCGHFHSLDAFEGSRRSCQAKLEEHNRRRRQPNSPPRPAKSEAAARVHESKRSRSASAEKDWQDAAAAFVTEHHRASPASPLAALRGDDDLSDVDTDMTATNSVETAPDDAPMTPALQMMSAVPVGTPMAPLRTHLALQTRSSPQPQPQPQPHGRPDSAPPDELGPLPLPRLGGMGVSSIDLLGLGEHYIGGSLQTIDGGASEDSSDDSVISFGDEDVAELYQMVANDEANDKHVRLEALSGNTF